MSVTQEYIQPDETMTLQVVALYSPSIYNFSHESVNDLAGTALICVGLDGEHHVVRKPEGLWPANMPRTESVKQGNYYGVIEPSYQHGTYVQCKKIDEPYKFKLGQGIYQYKGGSYSLDNIVQSWGANLYPPPEKDYQNLFYTHQALGEDRRIVTGSAGEGAGGGECYVCFVYNRFDGSVRKYDEVLASSPTSAYQQCAASTAKPNDSLSPHYMSANAMRGCVGGGGQQGARGVPGAQGRQGTAGGAQGAAGAQGDQGMAGKHGALGNQGAQGADGTQGYQGVQGTSGVQGHQGDDGYFGAQGDQGVCCGGPQGAQGVEGTQGGPNYPALGCCWMVCAKAGDWGYQSAGGCEQLYVDQFYCQGYTESDFNFPISNIQQCFNSGVGPTEPDPDDLSDYSWEKRWAIGASYSIPVCYNSYGVQYSAEYADVPMIAQPPADPSNPAAIEFCVQAQLSWGSLGGFADDNEWNKGSQCTALVSCSDTPTGNCGAPKYCFDTSRDLCLNINTDGGYSNNMYPMTEGGAASVYYAVPDYAFSPGGCPGDNPEGVFSPPSWQSEIFTYIGPDGEIITMMY